MGGMRKVRRQMYRGASRLGDLDALASGNPAKIAKRAVRKRAYRVNGRWMRRLMRWMR